MSYEENVWARTHTHWACPVCLADFRAFCREINVRPSAKAAVSRIEGIGMIFWLAMRQAAIQRHWFVNQMFERGCQYRWQMHMAMIRAVYGW